MGVYVTTTNRGRIWSVALLALLVLALLATMLVLLPLAALTMLVGLALSGVALLVQQIGTLRASRRRTARPEAAESGPTLLIVDAAGEPMAARAVILPHPSEHTLALTRDGYVLIDADGRVFHRL